jgi:hypothetical protein
MGSGHIIGGSDALKRFCAQTCPCAGVLMLGNATKAPLREGHREQVKGAAREMTLRVTLLAVKCQWLKCS